jgi:hypothetical protein
VIAPKERQRNTRVSGQKQMLGYYFAVDASQDVDFAARLEKVSSTCSGATSTRLLYSEGLQLLNSRLLAQTKYGLHLSQFRP